MMKICDANARRLRFASMTLAAVMALGLAGCAKMDQIKTGSIGRSASNAPIETMSAQQLASTADSLGQSYAKNPKDINVAMRYASVLDRKSVV